MTTAVNQCTVAHLENQEEVYRNAYKTVLDLQKSVIAICPTLRDEDSYPPKHPISMTSLEEMAAHGPSRADHGEVFEEKIAMIRETIDQHRIEIRTLRLCILRKLSETLGPTASSDNGGPEQVDIEEPESKIQTARELLDLLIKVESTNAQIEDWSEEMGEWRE